MILFRFLNNEKFKKEMSIKNFQRVKPIFRIDCSFNIHSDDFTPYIFYRDTSFVTKTYSGDLGDDKQTYSFWST